MAPTANTQDPMPYANLDRLIKMQCSRQRFTVPIFEATVWIVLSNTVQEGRKTLDRVFGPDPDDSDYQAVCIWDGGNNFGIIFKASTIGVNTIAHEVFHLTHRILEWCSAGVDKDHHEHGAMLNAYLLTTIFKMLVCPPKTKQAK